MYSCTGVPGKVDDECTYFAYLQVWSVLTVLLHNTQLDEYMGCWHHTC